MEKIVLIDGNSILNRAFYGIMGSKMLTTPDGKYTNAVYGFLAILFKVLEDIKPEYLMVAFDLKAPTARHKMYEGYKANRKGMPNELAEQIPIVKEILRAMNIVIIEREGYEADDVLGTLSKMAEKEGLNVTIVSGDRDTFQLTSNNITVRIPHTKLGKTETDYFDEKAIIETYGLLPKQLIEVKGLMGDSSDNIPGVPGIGEKTALDLIKKYETIANIYEKIEKNEDDIKGKTREKLIENKALAELSRTLGTINLEVPLTEKVEELRIKEWNKEVVFAKFKELNFNRFIERFSLQDESQEAKDIHTLFSIEKITIADSQKVIACTNEIKEKKQMFYLLATNKTENAEYIIKKDIQAIAIYQPEENKVYYITSNSKELFQTYFQEIMENAEILKYSTALNEDYVLLKQIGINLKGIYFDTTVAAYDLNPTNNHYAIEELAIQYLNLDINSYLENVEGKEARNQQINLFEQETEAKQDFSMYKNGIKVYAIAKVCEVLTNQLKEINSMELFEKIEMPLVEVLGNMQWNGIHVNKQELIDFGAILKSQLEELTKEIYELCEEEFNVNSTQQLGKILFEKLQLPVYKKTKSGYSTDVDILEKLKGEHPVIEKILTYRTLTKLNSTYVEGLIQYINPKTNKIHSYFHQTITATGRISSTEPNLQNIPTRVEQGKQIRKAFQPEKGNIFIDADYSQIELRVLAHISQDENMIHAFQNDEDIHKQVASKVFEVSFEEVTKEQRSAAKAVNFGIVYGISDFGLSEQLGIGRKKAKNYIEQYLEKYSGVKKFMDDVVEKAKEDGYVETLFHRRRYITELASNNYMVRQFGARAAMNTPIQGTAADIMKIAMIHVLQELEKQSLEAKIILQVHDELIIECKIEEKEQVKKLLQDCMENAIKLDIPLKVEVSEATTWYEAK